MCCMTMQNFDIYSHEQKEKLVRAVLNFIPIIGTGAEKLLYASKDGEKSKLMEETFEFLKNNLSQLVMNEIIIKSDIDNIKKLLEMELKNNDKLFRSIIFFFEKQGIIINEIKETIINSKKNETDRMDAIAYDIKEIKALLIKENDSIDKNILTLLFNNIFKSFELNIKNFHLPEILEFINSIKSMPNFNELPIIIKSEILSYEAEIYIKQENIEDADKIYPTIKALNVYTVRICDYLSHYATIKRNEYLFNDMIVKYNELGVTENKIIRKKVFWNYYIKKYDIIIDLLCDDKENFKIKEIYSGIAEANFFIGIVLFEKKKYNEALNYFNMALDKEPLFEHKYFAILAQAYEIIDKRGILYTMTQEQKNKLKALFMEFISNDINDYVNRTTVKIIEEYWTHRLTLIAYYDISLAYEEYLKSPQNIKRGFEFKNITADIFFYNNKYSDALEILLELYHQSKDTHLTKRILSCFYKLNLFEKAEEFSSEIKEYDAEGVTASLLIECYAKRKSYEEIQIYAQAFIDTTKFPVFIYKTLARLEYDKGNQTGAYNYYVKMIDSIPDDNYAPRLLFGQELREINLFDLALKVIEPYLKYSYEAEKGFVNDAIKIGTKAQIEQASIIIDKYLISKIDIETWFAHKANLEYGRGNFNICKKYIGKLFEIKQTPDIAYNYALLKLKLNEYDLVNLVDILKNGKKALYLMTAADCYYVMGDYENAESISLIAFAANGNEFNEEVFINYIRLNLGPKPGMPNIAEMEEVTSDCTVMLVNESKSIWIGITSKSEILYSEHINCFAETQFYFRNKAEVISLIGQLKGNEIEFAGDKWVIREIWKIKTRVLRFCMENMPESKYFRTIQFNPEHPLESMMPELVEGEIYEKQILADYNFRNTIGLPLNQIALHKGRNIADAILFILEMPNQLFYTGEITQFIKDNSKILLSPSSIIILSILKLLEDFIIKFQGRVVISNKTFGYFVQIIDKMNTLEYGIKMSIGIENGHFKGTEYSKEVKNKNLNFFNNILAALTPINQNNIEINPEELDEKKNYINLLSLIEYENSLK